MNPRYEDLHFFLDHHLRERGLSNQEFATMLGKDPSTVSLYRNGKSPPSGKAMGEILRALEITPREFWAPDLSQSGAVAGDVKESDA